MKSPLKLAAVFFSAVLAAGVLFLSSCSPRSDKTPVYTGATISQTEISQRLGYQWFTDKYTSLNYEVVDHDWLISSYHDIFWSKLFSEDITKWDARANCAIFTEEYVAGLQRAYYRDHFHSSTPAWRLAAGEFWYLPNPADPNTAHSIVVVITNKGVIYLEPQARAAAKILALTPEQIASRILRKI